MLLSKFRSIPRQTTIIILIVAAILIAAALFVVLWKTTAQPEATKATQTTETSAAPPTSPSTPASTPATPKKEKTPDPKDVASGTKVLQEELPKAPKEAVAKKSQEYFNVDLGTVFPPGTKVEVDQKLWNTIDENTAMVPVAITRPGEKRTEYTAFLVRENGKWKVDGTVELKREQ